MGSEMCIRDREEAVKWRLQEGKEGYVPSQSDRENTGVLEDIRFILDQIMYDTLSGAKVIIIQT